MTRPVNPNISIPSAFAINGTKTDFTNEKIQDGFDDTTPDILAGDNLNKFIDDTYKGLNYSMAGVEDLYGVTDGLKDLSNLSASGQAILNNKANKDLSNLSATGEAHFANPDLSNLSTNGNNRLHALKGYLDNGEVLTDSEGLEDVVNYAHSTFDSTKFTALKVGTPTITNDGILTSSDTNNYIKYTVGSLPASWGVRLKVTTPTVPTTQGNTALFVRRAGNANAKVIIRIDNNSSKILVGYYNSDGTYTNNSFNVTAFTDYYFDVSASGANLTVKVNGENYVTATNLNTSENIDNITIGSQSGYNTWTGTLDLKYFSYYENGIPVFQGTKTGIDVIKPDNFTVVGTPTISNDGIVTNYDRSNVVRGYNILNLLNKSWKIKTVFRYDNPTIANPLFTFTDYISSGGVGINNDKSLSFNGKFGEINTEISNAIRFAYSETNFVVGNLYEVALEFDILTGKYTLSYKGLNDNLSGSKSYTPTSTDKQIRAIYLQTDYLLNICGGTIGWVGNACSIDLNAFKIYVDGNLVYQPCLKIPYTKSASKYGSKIVDAVYRDRVQDAWEQNFPQRYYTLDEANGNFTLPQGEIYGMINRLQENSNNEIGLPIVTLSNTLNDNEIWLEGASVLKIDYPRLYAVYGDIYEDSNNPTDSNHFRLPNCTDRVMQGINSTGTFGYIAPGLPNITGNIVNNPIFANAEDNSNGAFRTTNLSVALIGGGDGWQAKSISFDASRSSGIYGNSNTVQAPAIKVRVKTRYK